VSHVSNRVNRDGPTFTGPNRHVWDLIIRGALLGNAFWSNPISRVRPGWALQDSNLRPQPCESVNTLFTRRRDTTT
jgi:hypothetical protein